MVQYAHEVYRQAAVYLTLNHPFFSQLYYGTPNLVVDKDADFTACTNGATRKFGKAFMDALGARERQAWVKAHEVMHDALLHSWRRGTREPRLWNAACDYKVNQLLEESKFAAPLVDKKLRDFWIAHGVVSETAPKAQIGEHPWLRDKRFDAMSEEQIYNLLLDEQGGEGGGCSGGDGNVMPDVGDAEGSSAEMQEAMEKMKAAVVTAAKASKEFGAAPAWCDELVDTITNRKEKWHEKLRRYFTARSWHDYDHSKVNRRELSRTGIVAPMLYSEAIEHIVFGVDESGSIDAQLLAEFAAHCNDIMFDCKPVKVTVLYFDTQVSEHREEYGYADLPITLRRVCGGGTSFVDVCHEAEELQADVLIVLTDLYGTLPDNCEVPVVWACTTDQVAPFGETIHVERD